MVLRSMCLKSLRSLRTFLRGPERRGDNMPAWSAACSVRKINRLEELSQASMPYPARLTGKTF